MKTSNAGLQSVVFEEAAVSVLLRRVVGQFVLQVWKKCAAFTSSVMCQFTDSTMKMEEVFSFEMLRGDNPTKQCNISEDLISRYKNRF